MKKVQLAIIGGGTGGMAAALAARHDGIQDIVILETDAHLGGVLHQCIHPGFGLHTFGEELTGPEYAARFIDRIHEEKIPYLLNTPVLSVSPDKHITAVSSGEGWLELAPDAIVVATGCRERSAGSISIPGTRPAGVMTAGTAQRFINIEGYLVGKRIVILGSGDIGLIMARRLTLEGAKVVCVAEIMPYSGGLNRNIVQCLQDFDIPLHLSTTVASIQGKNRVESVTLAPVDENMQPIMAKAWHEKCDTLLLSVGLIPETELFAEAGVKRSRTGGIVVNDMLQSSNEGIFAAGNAVQVHDLVDFVAAEGERAGHSAASYINGTLSRCANIPTEAGHGVSYVVPQRVLLDAGTRGLELNMRVNAVFRDNYLCLYGDDVLIKRVKRRHMAPGEMEKLTLNPGEAELSKIGLLRVEVREA